MDFPQTPPEYGYVPLKLLSSDPALPTTTNVQKSLLGGSDTSNLSPSSIEVAPSKPKERKSYDGINGGKWARRDWTKRLLPQILCGETKSDLDSGQDNLDVAASLSSAIPATKSDPEIQKNEASTSKFEKIDRDMSVHTGRTNNSNMRNDAINGGDKITVDSQDVGPDNLTAAEPRKQLKVRLRHELGRDVVMRNEDTEVQGQLALKVNGENVTIDDISLSARKPGPEKRRWAGSIGEGGYNTGPPSGRSAWNMGRSTVEGLSPKNCSNLWMPRAKGLEASGISGAMRLRTADGQCRGGNAFGDEEIARGEPDGSLDTTRVGLK
ncbi:hypothetical protein V498_06169 [Pseudogymnoascus sp. VKM F-4517 (FW-2822)]|nr:hypothetical protein V498_06169 [Pseudogymnoascus sp. VKM F-4517 (FW-2822)]